MYVCMHVRMHTLWLKLVLLHLEAVGVAKLPQYPPRGFMPSSLDKELVEEEEPLGSKGGGGGKGRRGGEGEEHYTYCT